MVVRDTKRFYTVAFGIGMAAALVLSVTTLLARSAGITDMSFEIALGSVLSGAPDPVALVSGFFCLLGLAPQLHPLMPEILPAPGVFMVNGGISDGVLFFALHLIYGAIVGYGVQKVAATRFLDSEEEPEFRRAA
jgi:hypothetical protein